MLVSLSVECEIYTMAEARSLSPRAGPFAVTATFERDPILAHLCR